MTPTNTSSASEVRKDGDEGGDNVLDQSTTLQVTGASNDGCGSSEGSGSKCQQDDSETHGVYIPEMQMSNCKKREYAKLLVVNESEWNSAGTERIKKAKKD